MKNKHNKVAVHPPFHRNTTRGDLLRLVRHAYRTDMVVCRAILLALHAGVRRAEILKLCFRDIDLALMVIIGSSRCIPVTAVLAEWLALFPVGAPDYLVVPLTATEFARRLTKLKKAAGVSSFGKDVFRRSYAASQFWSAPAATQKAMLGHSDNHTTSAHYHGLVDGFLASLSPSALNITEAPSEE